MASFEEKQEFLENMLGRVAQAQEQGQANLERALRRVEGLIPIAGESVANALKSSTNQAARAHQEALSKIIEEVASEARTTTAEAAEAFDEIRRSLQAEVDASRGILNTVNDEAERASGLLQRMGEHGAQGVTMVRAIQSDLGSLREAVEAHKVELRGAIRRAEADAQNELSELRNRIRSMLPSYLLWMREATNVGIFVVVLTCAFAAAYFAAVAYVEKNKGDQIRAEIVRKMVPVGKAWTAYQTTTSRGGESSVELRWKDLDTPILEVDKGVYEAMQPDGQGGWISRRYPKLRWQQLGTATVYQDQSRMRQLNE